MAASERPRDGKVSFLAAAALISTVIFTVAWVATAIASPGFSVLDNDTSDLGALTAPHPTLYNLGVSLSGLLTIPLAVALVRAFGRGKAVIGTAMLTAVFGLGEIIDGIAREDCAASVNAMCRAAEKAGRISTHHKIHNVESLFTFVALALAPLVAAGLFNSLERRPLALASVVAGVVQLVCLPVFLAMYSNGTHLQGLVEVVELMAGTLWIAAVSVALMAPRVGASMQAETPTLGEQTP